MAPLPAEPTLLPEDLFEGETASPRNDGEPWWVLHTRPRAEKTVARHLYARQVSFYLPLYQQSRILQRRQVKTYLPLFPGYVFLRGGDPARAAAFETNKLAGCHPVDDQARLDEELRGVYRMIASGLPILPEEQLEPGAPAEIISGPLAGHRGVVVRRGKSLRFVVQVNFLQHGASVEVDAAMLQTL
jgi:transcriptional antiterminator RfaH